MNFGSLFQQFMGGGGGGGQQQQAPQHAAPPPALGAGGPPTRWEKAVSALNGVVQQVAKSDPDGIDIMVFPGTTGHVDIVRNVKDTESVRPIVNAKQPGGPCYMGYALDQAFREAFQRGFQKPTSILVLTAGRPDDHEQLVTNVTNAAKAVQKDSDMTVTFVQVGDDQWAEQYLKHVDDNLTCVSASGEQIDIVDTVKDEDIKAAVGESQQPGFMGNGGCGALIGAFAGAAMGMGGMYMYNQSQAKKRTEGWNGTWNVIRNGQTVCTLKVHDDRNGTLTIDGYPEDGAAGTVTPSGSYADGAGGYTIQRMPFQNAASPTAQRLAGGKMECPNCECKGYFDTWGKPCRESSMHKKMACPLCDGARVLTEPHGKCGKCEGLGGFDCWDHACRPTSMHYRDACPMCDGKGWTPGGAPPAHVPVNTMPIHGTVEDEHNIVWTDGSRWEEVPPEGGSWMGYAAAGAGAAAAGGAVGYLVQKKFFNKAANGVPSDYVIILDRSQNMAVPDTGR